MFLVFILSVCLLYVGSVGVGGVVIVIMIMMRVRVMWGKVMAGTSRGGTMRMILMLCVNSVRMSAGSVFVSVMA